MAGAGGATRDTATPIGLDETSAPTTLPVGGVREAWWVFTPAENVAVVFDDMLSSGGDPTYPADLSLAVYNDTGYESPMDSFWDSTEPYRGWIAQSYDLRAGVTYYIQLDASAAWYYADFAFSAVLRVGPGYPGYSLTCTDWQDGTPHDEWYVSPGTVPYEWYTRQEYPSHHEWSNAEAYAAAALVQGHGGTYRGSFGANPYPLEITADPIWPTTNPPPAYLEATYVEQSVTLSPEPYYWDIPRPIDSADWPPGTDYYEFEEPTATLQHVTVEWELVSLWDNLTLFGSTSETGTLVTYVTVNGVIIASAGQAPISDYFAVTNSGSAVVAGPDVTIVAYNSGGLDLNNAISGAGFESGGHRLYLPQVTWTYLNPRARFCTIHYPDPPPWPDPPPDAFMPPRRMWPRDDELAGSTPRIWPPNQSRQRSIQQDAYF